jgi:GNAT superfamily N-acetyltransferase
MIITSPFIINDIHLLPQIQPVDWGDITPYFLFYIGSDFCRPLKYMNGDRLVGTGCIIFNDQTAWLAHIIVHPEYRGQGLGGRITQELLDIAEAKKCSTVSLLATHFGESVYAKRGFVREEEYLVFRGELQAFEADPKISDYTFEDEKRVLALDYTTSGEYRSHLLSPKLSTAKVYRNNGDIEGFYVPDLGDGFIAADTSEAGLALLQLRLNTKNFVAFPENNIPVRNLLTGCGYSQTYAVRRMYIGEPLKSRSSEKCYSRIGGNLG